MTDGSQYASIPQRSSGIAYPNTQAGFGIASKNQSAQAPTVVRDRPVSQHLITGQLKNYHRHSSSDYMQRPVRPYSFNSNSSGSARPTSYDVKGAVIYDRTSQPPYQITSLTPHATAQTHVENNSEQGPIQLNTTHELHKRTGSLPLSEAHLAAAAVMDSSEGSYRQSRQVNGLGVPLRSPKRPMSYPNKTGNNLTKPVQLTQLVIGEPRRGYSVAQRLEQAPNTMPLTSLPEVLALKPLPPPPPPSKSPQETHPLLERSSPSSLGNKKSVHHAAFI